MGSPAAIQFHTTEREQRDKYPVISRDTLAPFKDTFELF